VGCKVSAGHELQRCSHQHRKQSSTRGNSQITGIQKEVGVDDFNMFYVGFPSDYISSHYPIRLDLILEGARDACSSNSSSISIPARLLMPCMSSVWSPFYSQFPTPLTYYEIFLMWRVLRVLYMHVNRCPDALAENSLLNQIANADAGITLSHMQNPKPVEDAGGHAAADR
jgi:hypothetical protein